MRILILNWRDIHNPDSGGAEVLTHEIAKRWVMWGHTVVQFSASYKDSVDNEIIDGITIIRQGSSDVRSFITPVHIKAYQWYLKNGKGKFDVVIDEIHGLPFFTPLYIQEKKVALICEVANELWDITFPFPLNIIGKKIEQNYFHFYKHIPFLTISPSTRDDLIVKGVKNEQISVLPMGLSIPSGLHHYSKEKSPVLLFVGRLAKTKGVEILLQTLKNVKRDFPQTKLWIVGRGEDKTNFSDAAIYFGYVSEEEKFKLMSKAHIILVPSAKEGWGLIVPEAGYVGTPAVGYNVAGLRDVITNNGLLVEPNATSLTKGVIQLLSDKKLYLKLSLNARRNARKYSWDNTAKVALQIMKDI